MKNQKRLVANGLASATLILASTISHAAQSNSVSNEQPDTNAKNIEVIHIAGINRGISKPLVAGAVTVIDRTFIHASGALSIVDLLRTVPGVNLGQTGVTGGLSEVRFRGAESNHMLVLIDGIAINDLGQGNLVDFAHIPLPNVEKIEILKGPQSALWGASAIAGVINITTKDAYGRYPNGRLAMNVGNKETYSASIKVGQQRNEFGFNIGVSEYFTEGENISKTGSEEDGYKNTTFNVGLNYTQNAYNKVEFTSRLIDYTTDVDGYDFTTGLVGDTSDQTKGEQQTLGIDWHFAPTQQGKKIGIYSQLLSIQFAQQEATNYSEDAFSSLSKGETLRALWSNRFDFTSNKWITLGFENIDETFKQREAAPDGPSNQKQTNSTQSFVSTGLFGITSQFSLTGSYRYSNNREFKNEDSHRIGANYLFGDTAKLFISRGKAIQNPTFTERFGFFPRSFLGNPNLTPEQQTSDEAGIEFYLNNLTIGINYFSASLKNEILGFVFDSESGLFTAQNAISESTRDGIEISFSGSYRTVDINAQYSYLDSRQEQQNELRRSRHNGSISAIFNIDDQNQLYLQADYSGTKQDQFFPPFPEPAKLVALDAYWLVSANYTFNYSNELSFSARVTNATNSNYEDVFGYNTDSRRFFLSMQYNWGN